MFSKLTPVFAFLLLGGCATSPALRPTAADQRPENIRTLIAKEVLGTIVFGSIMKVKIIDATISAPDQQKRFLSDETYTSYCVNASIENPLFPLHRSVSAKVDIVPTNGHVIALATASPDRHCAGTGFEPFPEIERLSLQRYEGS